MKEMKGSTPTVVVPLCGRVTDDFFFLTVSLCFFLYCSNLPSGAYITFIITKKFT